LPTLTQERSPHRLGVVSYLNAKPLVAGLDSDSRVSLLFDVPARLAERLDAGEVDVALVPIIDLAGRDRDWKVVSDACIGCDGETFTVRVFSRVPPASIRRLHVDGESHTSVALAKIVWRETHGTTLEVLPYAPEIPVDQCEAVLLIGDKVVHNTLHDYPIETDLGSAWKSLTSLPFVFAAWAAPKGLATDEVATILSRARDKGVESAELIAADYGPGLNWPVTLAKRYLTKRLKYTLGPRQREAMRRFFDLAQKHAIISRAKDVLAA